MNRLAALLAPIAALTLLSGCATQFEARVNRFSSLPAPSGQSFAIQARDTRKAGGLEFATYANLVRQRLLATGYSEAAPGRASLVVNLDYAVSPPRERIETRPGFGPGYARFGFGGYYGRWGGYNRFGRPFGPGYYGGFGDPFFWDFYPEVTSTTLYNAFVEMQISRAADNVSVFEGRAETVATTNSLPRLVPNLVQAIFTNFPGQSGETVKVRFDPAKPGQAAVVSAGR